MDEALRTTLWRTITDEATVKKGSVGRRFRRRHRTAAMAIASEKSVRTAVGDIVADEAVGRRGAELETAAANEVAGLPQGLSLLWTRPHL